jgi:hypothetical protein
MASGAMKNEGSRTGPRVRAAIIVYYARQLSLRLANKQTNVPESHGRVAAGKQRCQKTTVLDSVTLPLRAWPRATQI